MEKNCFELYHCLPDPEFELQYHTWNPGFELMFPIINTDDNAKDNKRKNKLGDEDMAEALAEMEEEDEMKRQFNDVARRGYVDVDTAAFLARKHCLAPSNEDLVRFLQKNGKSMNYQLFLNFLEQCTHPEDNAEYMFSFFEQYDATGSGFLTKKQLCNLLQTWGEVLSSQEIEAFLAEFEIDNNVNYRELCKRIMTK